MSEVGETYGAARPAQAPEPVEVIPADAREEIEAVLSAFRQWLLDAGPWRSEAGPPPGVAEGNGAAVDLHTMLEEWIALKQEVRLESRGSKTSRERLDQAVDAFQEGLDRAHEQVQKTLDPLISARDHLRDEFHARLEARQRLWVDLLLEVRDALARGAESSREVRRKLGWRSWFLPRGLFGGLLEGHELALRRIDAALEGQDVRPIECAGRRVDPERMRVVDVVQRDDLPEGAVVDVVRRGYTDGARVIRFAEVRAVGRVDDGAPDPCDPGL